MIVSVLLRRSFGDNGPFFWRAFQEFRNKGEGEVQEKSVGRLTAYSTNFWSESCFKGWIDYLLLL